jgi:hypothetical protein
MPQPLDINDRRLACIPPYRGHTSLLSRVEQILEVRTSLCITLVVHRRHEHTSSLHSNDARAG